MSREFFFSQTILKPELVEDLQRQNPRWERHALPELPRHRRRLVRLIHGRLEGKLALIVGLRGPRQIRKSTRSAKSAAAERLQTGWAASRPF